MPNSEKLFKHEDERRTLIEWIEDELFCSSKVVIAKTDAPIGDHYHNKKNEVFLLVSGRAKRAIIGEKSFINVGAPKRWECPIGTYHRFELEPGSILVGVGDRKFDPGDEIKR